MPNPIHPKIKDAYENIKKITGLEFDEENLEEVQRALGQIYINGHDLFISSRLEAIRTNNDATVMAVSSMLTNILEGSKDERGFISIMNPNDPYAVPKVLYQNNEYDEAGRAYERDFREKHRKKIAALDKEMDNFVMPKSDHLKASDYFTADQFNRRTGRFRRQSDIWEFSRTEPAVQLCNLILLGRGYTMEDLLSDKEEVAEAKQNVGAELTRIMHEDLSLSERSRRFQELVKDSMDFLNNYTFRPVDLSDDTTLENVKYNQWVANMADNLGEVLKGAGQTFKSQWIADTGKRVDQIRNFAGGIAALDRVRLKGVDGKLRTPELMREPVLAQVLIEKAGMSYTRYHRSHFAAAAGEVDLRNELSETLKDHINGNAEYAEALRRGRETELYKDVFKQITERDLARQENNPVLKLAEEMDRIEQTVSTPERKYTEYGKELQRNFKEEKKPEESQKQEASEELSDDSVVEMGDPGDNVEDLARDSGEQIHAAAQEEEVPRRQEAQEDLPQMQEEEAPFAGSYDWSGELSPAQWKERLTKFYKEIDDHDPAWIRSSGEYRDVKHNLKKALDMLEDGSYSREAFNSRMEKAFRRAGDYIDKKNSGSIGKHYGKERLTTITELRELLAGRNKNPLDVKGVADLFGQKITRSVKGEEKIVEDTASQQEKLERGMKRLGIYLASAEDDNPEKVKGKMELVERVIAERGKNPETRSRLMDEMAKIRPAGDTAELMEQAMDRITDRMLSQKGLDRQAAGWGKVLKALQTTVQNSQDPAMKSAVNENVVKNYLRISNFAEKAQQVQNKILDSDNVKTLSQQEAGVIVAAATFSSLMKSTDENAVPCINYLFRNKTDKEILDYFAASADSRALQKLTDNESLKMQATEGIKLEMTGKAGASNLCRALAGHMQGGQEPVREQQLQKAPAMQAR